MSISFDWKPTPIIYHHLHLPQTHYIWEIEPNRRVCFQNIARIANAFQVTLWLSITSPQCHDSRFITVTVTVTVNVVVTLSTTGTLNPPLTSVTLKMDSLHSCEHSQPNHYLYYQTLGHKRWKKGASYDLTMGSHFSTMNQVKTYIIELNTNSNYKGRLVSYNWDLSIRWWKADLVCSILDMLIREPWGKTFTTLGLKTKGQDP